MGRVLWLLLGYITISTFGGIGRAQLTTATLHGIVQDSEGAVIPGATVSIFHRATGGETTKVTSATGEVQFDLLRVGNYTLSVEADGFKKFESTGFDLTAGQSIRQTYSLEIGSLTETVTVEGQASLVDTVTAEQRQSLSQYQVSKLPLARRNYTSVLAIGTGVSAAASSDGTGVRLNGTGKNGVAISVDGTDASGNAEARMTSMYQSFNYIDTISIEAVEEVQTVKGVAAAEYGNSLGGTVNIITRSGTNEWHGSAFENFQAEDLNARNQFLLTKPALTFNQFGASVGGPLMRDRLFIFGVYEGYRESSFLQVDGNVPTQKLVDEMISAQPEYRKALASMPLPNQPFAPGADVGFFRGAAAGTRSDNHGVIKGDIFLTDSARLSLTYTRFRPSRLLPRVDIGNDREWTGVQERGTANFIMGGSSWSAETRFGYNLNNITRIDGFFTNGIDPDRPETTLGGRRIPRIIGPGFSTAETEMFEMRGPVWTLEQKYALFKGQHSLKFGARYSSRGGGRFNVENAHATYVNKEDLLADRPSSLRVTLGVNPFRSDSYELGFFAQDDWRVGSNLVLNLGVRYDYFSKYVARPSTDAPAGLYNLDGLLDDKFNFGPVRDPLDPFDDDKGLNISPRFGFSYDVDGGRTVVRGGFGIMFSPLVWSNVVVAVGNSQFLPRRVTLSTKEAADFGLSFPVYNEDVGPKVEAQAKSQGKIQRSNIYKPNWQAPYTMNLYLGVQRALSSDLLFETAFVGNRGVKLMMIRTFNPVDRVTGFRPNPNLGEGVYVDDSQNTVYYSWQSSLRKRYSHNVSGSLHYTWGRGFAYTGGDIGDPSNGDSVSTVQDFFNWRAERSPSAGDVMHYVSSEWVYELPKLNGRTAAMRHALGGWEASGIFTAGTGSALLLSQPSGIASSRPDYVAGTTAVNSNYLDTLQYLNPAAFQRVATNPVSKATVRPGTVGYGLVRGPGRWNVDFSIGKNFALTERVQLQFRTDMFNALNHTNFNRIETQIDRPTFGRILGAEPARIIQLNARLTW